MDEMIARRNGQMVGPRVPIGRRVVPLAEEETVKGAWSLLPSRVVGRSSSSTSDSSSSTATCSNSSASNTCEKPTSMGVATEMSIGIL